MKKILLATTIGLFFGIFSVNAQSPTKEKSTLPTAEELKGTYQIEFLKGEETPISITLEIVEKIDKARKESEETFFYVNDKCRVKVFAKKELENLKKFPKEEFIIVNSFK